MFLMMHSCFIYGYMVSDIWQMITQIMRENPLLPLKGLINSKGFFIYLPSHRQGSTYHNLSYSVSTVIVF